MPEGIPMWLVGALVAALCYFLPPTVPRPTVVGMDLGTTYSGVGVFRIGNGSVDVVPDADGNPVISSWVAFTPGGVLVGEAARRQDLTNPENTVYDMKRFIGRRWHASMPAEAALYPFRLTECDGGPCVLPTCPGHATPHPPERIGAYLLSALKAAAEAHIGGKVDRVVLAVPVQFDDDQIAATKRAAELAGLTVARVLTEPTAAAMAYGLHEAPGRQQVLVVDMGGGTLDVSLLECAAGTFSMLAVDGDNRLGGEDVNRALMAHVADQMLARGYDVRGDADRGALQRLRDAVEDAKRRLSDEDAVPLVFQVAAYTHTGTLTRGELEAVCAPLAARLDTALARVFRKSGTSPDQVESVVLVGGSTRLPFVRRRIAGFFGGRLALYLKVPPELAVVIGTAIQAAIVGHYWPLPTAAIEDWEMIRAMREAGDSPEDAGAADEPPPPST